MLFYSSKFEIVRQLFDLFVDTVAAHQVYPYSGSGHEFLQFLDERISDAMRDGDLPESYLNFEPGQDININAFQNNVIALAGQMATDARNFNAGGLPQENVLHEWSLGRAIRRLCPLFPFLRQPCDRYQYLTGFYFDGNN